jgi:hypothetical protein
VEDWRNYRHIEFMEVPSNDYLPTFGIQAGDLVVFAKTTDVQTFDLAYKDLGDAVHVGMCRTKRGRAWRVYSNENLSRV